jgi:glycosyltransferase involved in cell wall biosynthesis
MARVAVVLPCKNEAASIASVVRSFRAALPDARIVVVDNASSDGTAEVAAEAGAVVISEQRPGKGFAVRRAFADVDADVYVMADGDATYDASAAPRMVDLLVSSGLDMVVGVRVPSANSLAYRRGHELGNSFLTNIFRRLFGLPLTDTLSGYRVMSRRFVKTFVYGRSGFEIETELNVHAAMLDARVAEVPTTYVERQLGSESKLHTYADGWRILRRNLRLYRDLRPARSFVILAAPWLLASVLLILPGVVEYFSTGQVQKFPSLIVGAGCLVVAAQLIVAGLILDRVALGRQESQRLAFLSFPAP